MDFIFFVGNFKSNSKFINSNSIFLNKQFQFPELIINSNSGFELSLSKSDPPQLPTSPSWGPLGRHHRGPVGRHQLCYTGPPIYILLAFYYSCVTVNVIYVYTCKLEINSFVNLSFVMCHFLIN